MRSAFGVLGRRPRRAARARGRRRPDCTGQRPIRHVAPGALRPRPGCGRSTPPRRNRRRHRSGARGPGRRCLGSSRRVPSCCAAPPALVLHQHAVDLVGVARIGRGPVEVPGDDAGDSAVAQGSGQERPGNRPLAPAPRADGRSPRRRPGRRTPRSVARRPGAAGHGCSGSSPRHCVASWRCSCSTSPR